MHPYALAHCSHMADDADELPSLLLEHLSGIQSFFERIGIERANAFIQKERIDLHTA